MTFAKLRVSFVESKIGKLKKFNAEPLKLPFLDISIIEKHRQYLYFPQHTGSFS